MDEREAAGLIADAFEAGIAPWSRSRRLGLTCGLPMDAQSGQPILGIDGWLLELAAIDGRYRSSYWSVEEGWERLGGVVVRGEGTPVIDDGEGGGTGGELRYNLEQVEVRAKRPVTSLDRFWVAGWSLPYYEMAGRVLKTSGATVVSDGCCRCVVYRDGEDRDFIGMPPLEFFGGDLDRFWSAMFHELTHWVHLRCLRGRWDPDPSPGELIAEFGAAILSTRCGIPMDGRMQPDCALVREWVACIRRDHRYLPQALKVAEIAAAYLFCLAGYET